MGKYRAYAEYKDSGVEWVGAIPEGWNVFPTFRVFNEQKVCNDLGQITNVLSLSYGRIIRRDVEKNFGLLPESFNTYQIVKPNNLILRLTDLQNDKRSLRVGQVEEEGIITSEKWVHFFGPVSGKTKVDRFMGYAAFFGQARGGTPSGLNC